MLTALAAPVLVWIGLRGLADDPMKIGASPLQTVLGWLLAMAGAAHVLSLPWRRSERSGGRSGCGMGRRMAPRLRLWWICVCLGWLAILLLGRPFLPARVALLGGIALGSFAALDLLAPRLAVLLPRRLLRAADFGLTVLCVVLLGTEVALRVLARVAPGPLLARPSDSVGEALASFRYPPGMLRFGFPCNSGGHFDEEFAAKQGSLPLVVSVGDSFAAGIVPHRVHFTTQIERLLRPTVVHNFGLPAIGPREYLHLLETEAMPLQPDLVLVNLFVGNDLDPVRVEARWPWLSSWFNAENALLVVLPSRLAAVRAERAAMDRDEVGIVGEREGPGEHDAAGAVPAWVLDPTLEWASLSDERFLSVESRIVAAICDPERSRGYPACRELLLEIAEVVGKERLVIAMIPDVFQLDDALWQRLLAAAGGGPLRRDLAQETLVPWCREQQLRCIDLLGPLRAAEPWVDGQLHLYHHKDTHWNARGNAVAARAIAAVLQPLLGVDPTPWRAGFSVYGEGCPGPDGRRPTLRGSHEPGGAPMLRVADAPANCAGVLRLGAGRQIAPIPSPRCQVQILPLLPGGTDFTTDSAGCAELPLQLPPGLEPANLYLQVALLAGGDWTVTNELHARIP